MVFWYHMYFALRLDVSDDDRLRSLLSFLSVLACGYLVVRETVEGGNPHVHAVLELDSPIRRLRQRMLRHLDWLRGNGDYSLTVCRDVDKYYRYLCKGEDADAGPCVVGRQGLLFTDVWIEEQHAAYWDTNRAYKRREKLPGSAVEYVHRQCINKGISHTQEQLIAREYIALLSRQKKSVNFFLVQAVVRGVRLQLCPNDAVLLELAEAAVPSGYGGVVADV